MPAAAFLIQSSFLRLAAGSVPSPYGDYGSKQCESVEFNKFSFRFPPLAGIMVLNMVVINLYGGPCSGFPSPCGDYGS